MLYKILKTCFCEGVYLKAGEVKELSDEVAAAVGLKRAVPAQGAAVAAAPKEDGGSEDKSLDKMTKAELSAKALALGFSQELVDSLDKAGLVQTIQEELDAEAAKK